MKKLIGVLSAAVIALGLAGCSMGTDTIEHVHTYSSAWTSDATSHWHAPTCDDTTEVKDKAEHTFGDWKVTKAATVDATGEKVRECTVCTYKETATIEKHVHTFATYWSSDENNHWHAATCGDTTEVTDKAAHTLVDCVKEGISGKECSVCKYTNIAATATPVLTADNDCKVTITCATEGAVIYYTTDGSEPTSSSDVYSTKVYAYNLTVKAIAKKDGMTTSSVASYKPAIVSYYNGGHGGTAPARFVVNAGTTLTADQLPALTDSEYDFTGWYFNGVKVEAGYKVEGNVALTANWTKKQLTTSEHLRAVATDKGIEVTITLASGETLSENWGGLYEKTSGFYCGLTGKVPGATSDSDTIQAKLNTDKPYTILFPFTEAGKIYEFYLTGRYNNPARGAGDSAKYWQSETTEAVYCTATTTTQYGSISSAKFSETTTSVSCTETDGKQTYKAESTYTLDALKSDVPFITDSSKKDIVKIGNTVLYGKKNWAGSAWLNGSNTTIDTFFASNSVSYTIDKNQTNMNRFGEYCACFCVNIFVPDSFTWNTDGVWSNEVAYTSEFTVKKFGNIRLPDYADGEYWYAQYTSNSVVYDCAAVFTSWGEFILGSADTSGNERVRKGTYTKSGNEYAMTQTHYRDVATADINFTTGWNNASGSYSGTLADGKLIISGVSLSKQ